MEKNATPKRIAQQFVDAYDRHDVEAMTALCTSDARGRYVPYGRESVAPIRGGIDAIWRAFALPSVTPVPKNSAHPPSPASAYGCGTK